LFLQKTDISISDIATNVAVASVSARGVSLPFPQFPLNPLPGQFSTSVCMYVQSLILLPSHSPCHEMLITT